jgi:hypothetical protein
VGMCVCVCVLCKACWFLLSRVGHNCDGQMAGRAGLHGQNDQESAMGITCISVMLVCLRDKFLQRGCLL